MPLAFLVRENRYIAVGIAAGVVQTKKTRDGIYPSRQSHFTNPFSNELSIAKAIPPVHNKKLHDAKRSPFSTSTNLNRSRSKPVRQVNDSSISPPTSLRQARQRHGTKLMLILINRHFLKTSDQTCHSKACSAIESIQYD